MSDVNRMYELEYPSPEVATDSSDGPTLIVALQGYADAGHAIDGAATHIKAALESHPVVSFHNDELIDYRSRRPAVTLQDDHLDGFSDLSLDLRVLRDNQGKSFLLLSGPEPDFRWEAFTTAVADLADKYGVAQTLCLYASPMQVPHTRPMVVLAHGNDAAPESNYRVIAAAVETLPAGTPGSLMSAIAVTQDIPAFSEILEWRRRGERLLRASALWHTIIRPGWFDGHSPGDDRPEMEQGDATPLGAMRGVQRRHIAAALVEAVRTPAAARRTLELFSGPGEPIDDWPEAFAALDADTADRLDGVHDPAGLPLAEEPAAVRDALRKYGS